MSFIIRLCLQRSLWRDQMKHLHVFNFEPKWLYSCHNVMTGCLKFTTMALVISLVTHSYLPGVCTWWQSLHTHTHTHTHTHILFLAVVATRSDDEDADDEEGADKQQKDDELSLGQAAAIRCRVLTARGIFITCTNKTTIQVSDYSDREGGNIESCMIHLEIAGIWHLNCPVCYLYVLKFVTYTPLLAR